MSMKPPPRFVPNPGTPPVIFKKVSQLLALPLTAIRETPKFCLCLTCLELVINDTIINSILCPNCPNVLTMATYERFSDAIGVAEMWMEKRNNRAQTSSGADDMGGRGAPPAA